MEKHILDNGKMLHRTVKELTNSLMEISTLGNGKNGTFMDKGLTYTLMEKVIRVSTKMVN